MITLNKVELFGRFTKDVAVSYTKENKQVARFTVAVANPMNREESVFVPCVAFGKSAEVLAKGGKKGDRILLEGFLSISNYQAKDGTTKTSTNVVVEGFPNLIDYKASGLSTDTREDVESSEVQEKDLSESLITDDIDDKDLPF